MKVRQVKWSDLWFIEQLRISMPLCSVHDFLPTSVNLYNWKLSEQRACTGCVKPRRLQHILVGCSSDISTPGDPTRCQKSLPLLWKANVKVRVLSLLRGERVLKGHQTEEVVLYCWVLSKPCIALFFKV